MRKRNFIDFFLPSEQALSKLTTKERGQIPIVIYGNLIFIIGFFGTTIAELLRGTYVSMSFSIVTQLTFLVAAIIMKRDKIEVAMTIDTLGMLVAIAGFVFFLGMGNTPLEIYRSICFIVVMSIFNQFFSIRRYQLRIFLVATIGVWIVAAILEFRALKDVDYFETILALVIGSIALGTSLYGMYLLWNQNQKVMNEAVQGREAADSSLLTIRNVLEQSSAGLEIGNQLNEEVRNVNSNINNISELYQYLSIESEKLSNQTALVNSSSMDVIAQVSRMQENVSSQNKSLVSNLNAIGQIAEELSNITAIAESKKLAMNELINSFDLQLTQIKELVNDVNLVQESSNAIRNFVDTVNKIATQTGLLAMNASIEAAHAGVLGKGFSVIAHEIRNLSEQTASNAARITEQLNANAELVEGVTISASKCESNTSKGNMELHSTVKAIEEIIASVSEINTGTSGIMFSLKALEGEAVETDSLVKKSVEQIKNQNITIENISTFADTLNKRVDSLEDVLAKIKSSMDNVNDVAQKNARTSADITNTLKGI